MTDAASEDPVGAAAESLLKLTASRPELAEMLSTIIKAIADEATRSPRFANALTAPLYPRSSGPPPAKRSARRRPGVIDPFAVYNDIGEEGLRRRLFKLDLEELRDLIAEHGMDHDRLAMKWKDPKRVIDRIVEKVAARSAKGSAFRSTSE
ncbi:hypothetical protein [Mycolicibacterium mucogenicum]|uniref:Uncharacterized protein n=1 Tax=Mycolicibacterium mucogenicum DSM 44124 TaxID=1226753 RepID=A0A8H2J980_MYCMU|nr:hypothetical protein [Mycolicibacterium mucogenicum]KAB7761331.1 hypothetical protein MMUC44124_01855 [Mycolicibacterium mucogenicum DSM 44124]QPG70153.1 hypothetical protein C1S78_003805 [Mycolicibacterium mucogenicum DSM 44124]